MTQKPSNCHQERKNLRLVGRAPPEDRTATSPLMLPPSAKGVFLLLGGFRCLVRVTSSSVFALVLPKNYSIGRFRISRTEHLDCLGVAFPRARLGPMH